MLFSCGDKSIEGLVVFTGIPSGEVEESLAPEHPMTHYEKGVLYAVNPDDPGSSPNMLTGEFAAAATPAVSHCGAWLFFSAKKDKGSPWQIWRMDTRSGKSFQVTSFSEDCMFPVWHPAGRVIFSRSQADGTMNLYSCDLSGENVSQITFHPHRDIAAGMMYDGRILVNSMQTHPMAGAARFIVMRQDGTKAELFHQGEGSLVPVPVFSESTEGEVIFIEASRPGGLGGSLARVHQNRPLYTYEPLQVSGTFNKVLRTVSGSYLVSSTENGKGSYGISLTDLDPGVPGTLVFRQEGLHAIQPVLIEARQRVRKLPSAVMADSETGLLMCQDIKETMLPPPEGSETSTDAAAIRIVFIDGTTHDIPAEADGSVYMELTADKAFQIYTLDHQGNVIQGPSSWIWLRPNERRGCVGCHADPELAPHNRVPFAVKNPPVSVPASGDNTREGVKP